MTNDRASFLRLFLSHEDDLRAYIGSLVRDAAERDDIFQNVAVTLWQKFETFEAGRSFGAWARGVATKKILQERRRNARLPLALPPEAIERVLDAFERAASARPARGEREKALLECLRGLAPKSRELLLRRYREGECGTLLARTFQRSVAAIYQMLSRARAQLGDCIRERLCVSPES